MNRNDLKTPYTIYYLVNLVSIYYLENNQIYFKYCRIEQIKDE